jgi:hypothetical protein
MVRKQINIALFLSNLRQFFRMPNCCSESKLHSENLLIQSFEFVSVCFLVYPIDNIYIHDIWYRNTEHTKWRTCDFIDVSSVRKPEGYDCESPAPTALLSRATQCPQSSFVFSVVCSFAGHWFEMALSICSHLLKYYRLWAQFLYGKLIIDMEIALARRLLFT